LPIDLDTRDLAAAWYLAVSEAVEEAEGGSLGSLERSLMEKQPTRVSEEFRRLAARLSQTGTVGGEPGTKRTIGGKEPRAIELALRQRMFDAGHPLPRISKTYASLARV
jgi:hypothetical protein